MALVNLSDLPLGLAAADYSVAGLTVLPLTPGDKPPLWGLGWEDASGEPERIMEWWGMEPRANVGVACTGELVVVDVDGPEGEGLLAQLGPVVTGYQVNTGRGRHLYYRRPEGLTEGWRYGGLELKANGYVVAPPSRHPSGAVYYASQPTMELVELPEVLRTSPRPKPERSSTPLTATQDPERLAAAGRAALEGELDKLRSHSSEPGTGRHTALYAAAAALGHHVAAGGLSEQLVRRAVLDAASALGLPDDRETMHQVEHGLAEGKAEPYQLTDRPQAIAAPTPQAETNGRVGPVLRPRLTGAHEVKIRRVEWAWEQRVPLGKLSVLGGLAGQGKSALSCWLAARASRGELPGELEGQPVPVVMVSAEDDPEDTIVPRLLRNGADPRLITMLDMREHAVGRDYTRSIALPEDTPAILWALEETGARLLILDPISGLLSGDVDSYKSQHVRAALGPIKAVAEDRNAGVLIITHVLPKAQGTDPLQRLADSHAFSALPRSVLILGPDPEDEGTDGDRGDRKLLTVAKSNLATPGEHGLLYQVTDSELISDGHGGVALAPGMMMLGASSSTSADSLATPAERTALSEAMEFLRTVLADEAMRSSALAADAAAVGISERTLERARAKVCQRAYRTPEGHWMVALRPPPGGLGGVGGLSSAPGDAKSAKDAKAAKGGEDTAVVSLFPDTDPETPRGDA